MDCTKKVFKSISEVKPKRLYISCDGPRKNINGESIKVQEIRKFLLDNVDWDCELKTSFKDENLGCGRNVKESIDWFFSFEESGIIIEDDCLPTEQFYLFSQELLRRYRDDDRVGMICGVNHFVDYYQCEQSYLFSRYKSCWGWASWRRAWKHMDFEMSWLASSEKEAIISNMGYSNVSKIHWKNAIRKIMNQEVDTWDWQWYFSMAIRNQLAVFPEKNLVSNIGFGPNATNSSSYSKKRFTQTERIDFPLLHPKRIEPNIQFEKVFERKKLRLQILKDLVPTKLKKRLKNVRKAH
ncbi:MAG: hemolysin hemolytic protein [Bacteroidota bacterium]